MPARSTTAGKPAARRPDVKRTRGKKPPAPSKSAPGPPPVTAVAPALEDQPPLPAARKRTRAKKTPAAPPPDPAPLPAARKRTRVKKTPATPLPAVPPPASVGAVLPAPPATANAPPPRPASRIGKTHCPPSGQRALTLALRKAAKFQLQVAAASSLDESSPVVAEASSPPPILQARARKEHRPPSGQRALEIALRKAAKFQAQVAALSSAASLPAVPEPVLPTLVAAETAPLPERFPCAVPHPVRARKALSSPRGQRALELAMRKAAGTLAASTPPAVQPSAVAKAVPALPARRRLIPSPFRLRTWATGRAAVSWIALAAGLVVGSLLIVYKNHRRQDPVLLAKPRPSLEWLHQAEDRAADGSFRLALDTVERALTDSPDNTALLKFKGDMHQSLLQFGDAQTDYEQALRANPSNKWAHENLVLSRRLGRSTDRPAGRLSTLYGLHRALLIQGRLDEAIAISNQLPADFELSQKTWQAALDRTGLRGRVTVDDQGVMSLDLSGCAQPDLTLIQKFPVRRLYLAGTGLENLRPLEGLPLETLDLSNTPIYDLAPLRGMPLEVLGIAHTGVVDLTPLEGCPLRDLDLTGTRVAGVEALARMPLVSLQADGTLLTDLRPLAALPLVRLSLSHTRVTDLRPLQHLGIEELILDGTNVADLTPLKGSALRELSLANTPVADLTPLMGTPLYVLSLQGCRNVKDLRPLLSCAELEHLRLPSGSKRLEALHKLPHLRFIEGEDGLSDKPVDGPATRNDLPPLR